MGSANEVGVANGGERQGAKVPSEMHVSEYLNKPLEPGNLYRVRAM